MSLRYILCIISFAVALATASTNAQPLTMAFTYQGQLLAAGTPANGLHDMRFRLHDALAGGSPVGSFVCVDNVPVTDGLFTVSLDFGAQFAGQQRFLEIEVRTNTGLDCTNAAGFTILGPRQALRATPYALFALTASTAGTATNATQLNGQAATFYQNASNLNAGTLGSAQLAGAYSSPLTLNNAGNTFAGAFSGNGSGLTGVNADLLDGLNSTAFLQSIPNPLTISGTSATHIIRGENASTTNFATGVFGLSTAATGSTYGLDGRSDSTSGSGVHGWNTAVTGTTYGGRFESFSPNGRGVSGLAASGTGTTYGVYGQNSSTEGRGVYGNATSTTGTTYGGRFESASTLGYGVYAFGGRFGVYGEATFGATSTYGGWFQSESTTGNGVYGLATAVMGQTRGGWFQSDSTSGRGVYGQVTSNTGANYGVLGAAELTAGYAVFASGDMGASGTKPFRIDHPDDPANKYLVHYATESPEVINFYRGTVMLNGGGEAVVEMPHYFAKINKEPSYQLTAVGAPMPNLHVADEIDETSLSIGSLAEPGQVSPLCWFRIAGGAPGAKVCWRVEAVRNDRYVQNRGAPVEIEKQDLERGTYQHPDLYGQPPEKGMNYDAQRDRPEPVRHDPVAVSGGRP